VTDPIPPLRAGTAPASAPTRVEQVAKQFEAVFLRQMIGSMRQASLGDGLFDSSAEDQFRDMGDAKLADGMAGGKTGGGGFGIAEMLTRQLGGKDAATK
jgi:flagellar protein FlgJ